MWVIQSCELCSNDVNNVSQICQLFNQPNNLTKMWSDKSANEQNKEIQSVMIYCFWLPRQFFEQVEQQIWTAKLSNNCEEFFTNSNSKLRIKYFKKRGKNAKKSNFKASGKFVYCSSDIWTHIIALKLYPITRKTFNMFTLTFVVFYSS
jgi:hypothetical protein